MKHINKVITIVFLMIVGIGVYHASTFISTDGEIMKSLYHVSHNVIILSLLYLIWDEIRKIKKYSIHRKNIIAMALYFVYKILLNLLYMFKGFRLFASNYNTNIWSVMLTLFIILIIIVIKYTKR